MKTPAALEIAAGLAANDSLEPAEAIVRAVGGLQGLSADLDRSSLQPREWAQSVADWAEVVWHRSGLDRVLDELDHLLPFPAPLAKAAGIEAGTGVGTEATITDAGTKASSGEASEDGTEPPRLSADYPAHDTAPEDSGEAPVDAVGGDAADPVERSAEISGGDSDKDRWKAERAAREARDARAAITSARNSAHARCFDLAESVRDIEALSRLARRIEAESGSDWGARMHVVAARTAQQDGDPAEVLRQVRLLLAIENPARPDPADG